MNAASAKPDQVRVGDFGRSTRWPGARAAKRRSPSRPAGARGRDVVRRSQKSTRQRAGRVSTTLVGVFERFTDRARRVLVLATEEASVLNHNYVGTEHILLGLIDEGDGVASRSLASLGVTAEAVRELLEETIGPAGAEVVGTPPFTPRAKRTMELALREALQLNHDYIGTEHLLLGLIQEGRGIAAQILGTLAEDLSRVRDAVMDVLAGDPGRPHPLAAISGEDVLVSSFPVPAESLLGWDDALPILARAIEADPRTQTAHIDGVDYETRTFVPARLPEISVSVAAARVTPEGFDRFSERLSGVELVTGIGEAATYCPATQSLRVLTDGVVFVVRVHRHPDPREIALAVAARVAANLAARA